MTNKQIARQIREFRRVRKGWMDILNSDTDSVNAAQYVLSINTKIEFLKTQYNWSIDPDDILW